MAITNLTGPGPFTPSDAQLTDAAFRAAWLATFAPSRGGTRSEDEDEDPPPGPRRAGWSTRSSFRGVYPTPEGRWAAKIRVAGRLHYCGTHDTEEEAARAVDARAVELLGEGARLNVVARGGGRAGDEDEDERAREEAESADLARHNAEFDRWEGMTDAERGREIRDATRLA